MGVSLFLVTVLNSVSLGVILFLLATGLSLILGVMGFLNLAHGALYMIGAYIGWTIAVQYGLDYSLAVLAGGFGGAAAGWLLYQFIRRLPNPHEQLGEQALLTIGFLLIVTNLMLWLWGPIPKGPFVPPFFLGSFNIMDWKYPIARAALIPMGLVLAFFLWWLRNKTRIGAIIRAGMDNKDVTMGLGINLKRISTLVFALGAFVAGFAGVTGATLFGANLELGTNILTLALVVVVIGGLGSIEGALLGGILIGLAESFGRILVPEFAMFLIYLTMIIILLVKPVGLLGRKI